nr:reverse transcriptase domain-containing protein [Tanacetum cinerariifolium]
MSTRSSTRNLFPPLDNPELTIRKRSRTDPTLLNNSEMAAQGNGDLPVPDLRTMEVLCQPSLTGQGGPISLIAIQATNFRLKNDMIQQVQNYCQFHGLPGDDANKHLDKFLHFDHLPRNSINTFEQMAKMFLEKYFPPSMVTKLRNEITNFHQRPNESLFEAWERYNLSIDRCPKHNMLPVTQIDTFYNGLTLRHRGTINAAAGGTFMKRRPEECYDLIENMTTHHNYWDTSAQRSESSSSITSSSNTKIAALKAEMAKINKNLIRVLQVNQQVKAVTLNCETCDGPHSFSDCPTTVGNTQNVYATGSYQVVTTNEFTNFMKANDAILKNMQTNMTSLINSNLELKNMFGQFMKMNTASSSGSETLLVKRETDVTKDTVHPANNGSTEDVQPLVVLTKSPNLNSKLVISPIIEPVASPVSTPKPNQRPSIPYPSRLHDQKLQLADRSISRPVGVAEDVFVKVGTFHFLADFVVIDFDADPRVPLILKRSFLKTEIALIDVFEGELTLRVGKEAITFNLDQTSRYSANYNDMMAKRIDVIDMDCEEYSQEVLGFFDVIASGNPTPYYDSIVSTTSPTLTPFENSDFLLEEVDAFLALEDDPTSPEVDQSYVDTKGDILLLEAFLNDDPSLPPPNQGNYLPQVELKDLPPHLKYAFLEGDDKLPVIIAKDLGVEEKTALITILKSHKRVISWKLSDIKGIDPEFCTHKILIEEDFEPAVQHQRRINPKIHDVIKNEVFKLLDAGLIYPIFDSPWVSPVYCIPKKGGFTVIENEENKLILTRLVTGNQYYYFLDGFSGYFQIPIDPKDQEKTTFTCPYGTFAYCRMPFGLCNAPCTFQRFMMAIFHDMIEKTMEVFMDNFSVFKNSFQTCLSHLQKTLKRCEDTNLCLNWEKSHFMVKEAPILIALDCDMPFELMYDASDFAIGAVLGKPLTFSKLATIDPPGDIMAQITQPRSNLVSPPNKWSGGDIKPWLKPILTRTVGENRTSCSDKLDDALWAFRTAYKTPIGCTPYKLVYRKEKNKRLHDSKIKDRVFNIEDRVLLFNSRLKIFSGKLKSCGSGPFTISYVFPYGTVELSHPDGSNFKVDGIETLLWRGHTEDGCL